MKIFEKLRGAFPVKIEKGKRVVWTDLNHQLKVSKHRFSQISKKGNIQVYSNIDQLME